MSDCGPRPTEVRVLFGTETGNAKTVAGRLAEAAAAGGIRARLAPLDDVSPDELAAGPAGTVPVLVVMATTGDGEMPYTAVKFWKAISGTSDLCLDGVPFAVLGLGDTGYFDFCRAAEVLDVRFEELGARRLLPMRTCDWDFDEVADEWVIDVLDLLTGWSDTGSESGVAAEGAAGRTAAGSAAAAGEAGASTTAAAGTTVAGTAAGATVAGTAAAVEPGPGRRGPAWNRERPYLATVAFSRLLTGAGALKPVCHVELAVDADALSYRAGDSLGVVPSNDPELVAAVLGHLGEDPELDVDGRPLRAVLTGSYEISRPSRELVEEIGRRTEDAELAALLAGSDRRALHEFLWARDVLDLLELPIRTPLTARELLAALSPLAHRSYSISSSPLVDPGRVGLTVASLRYSAAGRNRAGVCSTHLADRLTEGDDARVFLVPNETFRPPTDDTVDMIMVGPGTGVAPFRAFLHERRARGASGRNWLFFGARHQRCDSLYADELGEMRREGTLTRLDVAFSRDSRPKTYVQALMREHGKQLYAWLADGASLYVCGDATRMAGDVDEAVHEIVAEHGGLSSEDAAGYVDGLRRGHRYLRDVY
jgi:sulfite reductase (NADPH) flavoprotein alpha-component